MSEIICEQMAHRPAATQGWDQWGVVASDGSFTPLYGLESSLPKPSAYYYLAAAGVCDVRGKFAEGQAFPTDLASPKPTGDIAAASVTAQPQQTVSVAPKPEGQGVSTYVYGGLSAVVVLATIARLYFMVQGRKRDKTPAPKYQPNPFRGEK